MIRPLEISKAGAKDPELIEAAICTEIVIGRSEDTNPGLYEIRIHITDGGNRFGFHRKN